MSIELKDIKVDGEPVVIKELSVREIREWLGKLDNEAKEDIDVVSSLLFSACDLPTVIRMTSLTEESVEEMFPSQIAVVIEACKEKNASFFALARRVQAILGDVVDSNASS